MKVDYNRLAGRIGAMQTLIENFPMGIFSTYGDSYQSPIDFILYVLKLLGLDEITLTNNIIDLFFNVPNAVEIYKGMNNAFVYKKLKNPTDYQKENAVRDGVIPEATIASPDYILYDGEYYYKTTKIAHDPQSEFLTGLENNVKTILMNILTSILSCSLLPNIEEYNLDSNNNEITSPIEIPLKYIDTSGLLNICPTTDIGQNFYSVDADMTPNTLYKTQDLNAFLWYVLNRGTQITQNEKNKLMWDSRLVEQTDADYIRDTSEKWNYWYNSKTTNIEGGNWKLLPSGFTDNNIDAPLHPILQFYVNGVDGEKSISLLFPRQTYENKTIFDFNNDYLKNIKIFSPRVIISNMINELLSGNVLGTLNVSLKYSIEENILDAQINEIIKRALEQDDVKISDCFFSFSNDDYNTMLEQMEMERYGGKELNSETSPVMKIDEDFGLNALNQINSTATINEKIATITKTVFDISAIPGKDAAVEISDKWMLNYNCEWLNNIVFSIVRPLVKSLLSPKVMLLFMINFSVMGLINLEDIKSFRQILLVLYRKIMGTIISIVQYIKYELISYLINLYYKLLEPIIAKYIAIIGIEKINYWRTLLLEARLCLPTFKRTKVLTEIDDVNYADITQTSNVPESTETC